MAAVAPGLFSWLQEIPIISRYYLSSSLLLTLGCYLDFISPLTLYFNWDLVFMKGQYWRLFSSFLFFGTFSLDFVFHMYFVMRYCRLLEEGWFRSRSIDFALLLMYGATIMVLCVTYISFFSKIKFLGHPLTFMLVYLWSRDPDNARVQMSFLGVLQFEAPYLPWVLLSFSLLIGTPVEMDILGILVGHSYFFMDYVFPKIAVIRNWTTERIIVTPPFFSFFLFRNIEEVQVTNVSRFFLFRFLL
jgi:Derlin-2/3